MILQFLTVTLDSSLLKWTTEDDGTELVNGFMLDFICGYCEWYVIIHSHSDIIL